jgi:blue copper oxidase
MRTAIIAGIFIWISLSAFADAGPFSQQLPVPPILENLSDDPETAEFEIVAQEGTKEFIPGKQTPTFAFNGDYLGPTIRVRNGQKVSITVRNELEEMTTVHWHGLHIPGEMDGGPHQMIEPNGVWTPIFSIVQQAATLWYHPHPMGKTGEQAYKGMAGLFIIDDENSTSLDIPNRYGIDDIPLIIQDRRFFEDGTFAYAAAMPDIIHGVIGDKLIINGTIQPYLKIESGLVRFRVLNGSDSSVYRISFSDDIAFRQIATDGGFLEKSVHMRNAIISPGERIEILVDFSETASEAVRLIVEINGGGVFDALQIDRIDSAAKTGIKLPASERLNTITPIAESEAVAVRTFIMETMGPQGQLTINGKKMDMDRIDFRVPLDSTEIWEITNRGMGMMMNIPHSFHVHDVQFQILDINGKAPAPHESGWKDTVLIWPNETVRIIMRFEDFTGLYMYHCHFLVHEDQGMMGQFEVFTP